MIRIACALTMLACLIVTLGCGSQASKEAKTKSEAPPPTADGRPADDGGPLPKTRRVSDRPTMVKVFYATDRQAEAPQLTNTILAGGSGILALLLGVLTFLAKLRKFLFALTLAAVGAAVWTGMQIPREWEAREHFESGNRVYGGGKNLVDGRGRLEFGVCKVTIPPGHQLGKIESPSIWRLEVRVDPQKHIHIESVRARPEAAFFTELKAELKRTKRKQVLVFIHGYAVTFTDAAKRTAQLFHDLEFDGVAMFYSWPSQGKPTIPSYNVDGDRARWTRPRLVEFLRKVAEHTQSDSIHLIAHSMGNRVLSGALEKLADSNHPRKFNQVVMAAPDVAADTFREQYAEPIKRMANQVTLYASSRDKALLISRGLNESIRLGDSGRGRVVVDGIQTVDVSEIDHSIVGHSYYGENKRILADLKGLFNQHLPPENRAWLKRQLWEENLHYWVFQDVPFLDERPKKAEPSDGNGGPR